MRDKVWQLEHGGRRVRVTNRVSLLPPRTSEALQIDDEVAAENHGNVLRTFSVLGCDAEFAGMKKRVEARIARKAGGFGTGCHILVDGELVGGDVWAKLALPDLEAARKQYQRGAARFIVQTGLLTYGLPFAILMIFFNAPGTVAAAILAFLMHLLLFGGAMGWFMWLTVKSRIGKNER
jgi:hypothetical protein